MKEVEVAGGMLSCFPHVGGFLFEKIGVSFSSFVLSGKTAQQLSINLMYLLFGFWLSLGSRLGRSFFFLCINSKPVWISSFVCHSFSSLSL